MENNSVRYKLACIEMYLYFFDFAILALYQGIFNFYLLLFFLFCIAIVPYVVKKGEERKRGKKRKIRSFKKGLIIIAIQEVVFWLIFLCFMYFFL